MKKRILIVDDERDFTYSVRLGLEAWGEYEVREVNSATLALEAARQFRPHLVILDVMMPDLDGDEIAAQLRGDPLLCETPVIFCTALLPAGEARHGIHTSGGALFLPKPFEFENLVESIEECTLNVPADQLAEIA